MKKIQKTVINSTYQAINAKNITAGALIPFDCYIKRFNSYVVIIKAGTILSKKLSDKLGSQQLFIANIDRKKYDDFKIVRQQYTELSQKLLALPASARPIQEKITQLYEIGSTYMDQFFNNKNVQLDVTILNQFTNALLGILFNNRYKIEDFSVALNSIYTEAHHSVNVSIFSALFAKENDFEYEEVRQVTLAGLLHDTGKRDIDKKILDKTGELDEREFAIMKMHPGLSVEAAQVIGVEDDTILDAIAMHHEKLDGSGYPKGYFAHQISKFAQIVTICDTFDALTTKRTFRDKFSSFDALLMMKNEMNKQINENFIKRFIKMFKRQEV